MNEYAIFQINTDLLIIIIFTHENLRPPLHFQKIGALTRRGFWKHLYFIAFWQFLTVGEVCNITNKHILFNKSTKY